MRYLGTLVICVLLVGLTASAFAELKSTEVNGEVRVRGVWIGIPDIPALEAAGIRNNDLDVVEQRTRLGVEATFTDDVSAFIEFQMSNVWGDDPSRAGAPGGLVFSSAEVGYEDESPYDGYDGYDGYDIVGSLPGASEKVDVYQAYIQADDMFESAVSMRVGRQEMVYGTELLIGNNDFGVTGLSFDALKLMYQDGDLAIDVWWSKLVELGIIESDPDTDFYGIYGTYEGVEDMVIDAYLLLVRQANRNSGQWTDTDNQYTIGARAAGICPWSGLGYNAEVATQFGEDGLGRDYEGWLLDLLIDYKLEADYNPALFAGYTFSTGDGDAGDPSDNDNGQFTFPFTDNHARWGYSDLFGLGNLNVIKIGGSMCPTDDLVATAQFLWFLAHQDEDIPGLQGLRDSGSNHSSIAQEVDVSLTYNYTEDLQFEMTYGHIFLDDWSKDFLGDDDDIDLVYAQAVVSF